MKHNLRQKDLAKILKCTQSFVSRIERNYYDLEESQYRRLVKRFGEDEVSLFRGENPTRNDVSSSTNRRAYRFHPQKTIDSASIKTLAKIIKKQQEEISQLNARVEVLTDLLLKEGI